MAAALGHELGRVLSLAVWLAIALALLGGIATAASDAADKCATCKSLASRFAQALKDTRTKHFDGGNADWEARSLGNWATSETRLAEVLDRSCESNHDYSCNLQVEEAEEVIEEWFKSRTGPDDESRAEPEIKQKVCIDTLKVCCAESHFGKSCKPCPGLVDGKPCNGHGRCDGAGTRGGKGTCKCDSGYKGKTCRECSKGYYRDEATNSCLSCPAACSVCTGPTVDTCTKCATGYELKDGSCVDIDECVTGARNCTVDQYCANTPGSSACRSCHVACDRGHGCTGGESKDCAQCAPGYRRNSADGAGPCEDIDECAEGKTCEAGRFCQNGPGWSSCQACDAACNGCTGEGPGQCSACAAGYHKKQEGEGGSKFACVDVDECSTGAHNCTGEHRVCKNTAGGFSCACEEGYRLEGDLCLPVQASDAAPAAASTTPTASSAKDEL